MNITPGTSLIESSTTVKRNAEDENTSVQPPKSRKVQNRPRGGSSVRAKRQVTENPGITESLAEDIVDRALKPHIKPVLIPDSRNKLLKDPTPVKRSEYLAESPEVY